MSTLQATNLKNAASASNNIVLDTSGNATFAGTAAMSSSFLRNRIINGGFDVWQRGTSTSTNLAYLADRWIVASASGSITGSQSSDVPSSAFRFSLSASGTNTPQTLQRIESVNCLGLVGQSVTVSFWVKQTSGAGTNSMGVQILFPTTTDNYAAVTGITTNLITATSSWTYVTTTFSSLPAAAANGVQLLIYATTAGSAAFLVTGVQLEVGTAATPFERRQFGQELALCQRYAYAWGPGQQYVAAYSTGLYFDPSQITMIPYGINTSGMRSLSATITAFGTQGTDWLVQTAGGVNQTGFTLNWAAGVLFVVKAGHGITSGNCNLQVVSSNGRIVVATEL